MPIQFVQWPSVDMEPIVTSAGIRFEVARAAIVEWNGDLYRTPLIKTDFASSPALLRPVVGQVGRHASSAVVHDAAYQHVLQVQRGTDEVGQPIWQAANLTRTAADRMFLDLMQASGSAAWRRYLAWLGVRAVGRWYW